MRHTGLRHASAPPRMMVIAEPELDRREHPDLMIATAERRIDELTEAVRARDEFISIIAHELRNPMTPILIEVERLLIVARKGDAEQKLITGLERLDRLTHAYIRRATTLLDISRVTSGKPRIDIEPVDLSALIRQVTEELTPMAARAGSTLTMLIEDAVTGSLDRLSVERIADNLLSNAIKYGAGRPIEVTLARDADTACLRVRDCGIGIAPADMARIFERFERAVAHDRHASFGIGLWMATQLANAMGGEISVTSLPGAGSTFTVRLPLTPHEEMR